MKLVTRYDLKPIPVRIFDWTAVEDGYEPPMPIGYGSTELEAINDLLSQTQEHTNV